MSKNMRWRGLTIAILIVIALLYLTPSMMGELPEWWPGMLPEEKVHLGLDLQGGMHLILEVEVMEAVKKELDKVEGDLKEDLRSEKIRFKEPKRDGTAGLSITIMREQDKEPFEELIDKRYSNFEINDPVPLEKYFRYSLALKKEARDEIMKRAFDQARLTIENRIDQFGVAEHDIRPMEGNRIQIQLPGVKDPERAKKLIKQVAVLEFRLVNDEMSAADALKNGIPPDSEILDPVSVNGEAGADGRNSYLVKKRVELTGEYITDARVAFDEYNDPYVSLSLDNRGARIFSRVTEENVNKELAIIIDNKVQSAPSIREKIPNGKASISGRYTIDDARDLALVLRAGSLPAKVNFIEERTVGPSLGKDSIEKGFKSMIVGGVVVILFMVIYYSVSGIIANIALLLNVLFIMAGLVAMEATLTLPGIAGMILTIGMAVDANVLIFERIREELKLGKTPRTAIESGFSKAIVTILDANVTTFIAALVLFQFGTGPVRGFAATLSIGIVASFITAVFITRFVFDFLYIRLNWKKISI